jgi:NDP-sugar pyrophosphorylase family protein
MLPVAILAGGLATRLHPVSVQTPKSLIEIAGEPFLAHQLRLLHSQGIRSVVLCVGHLGEQIQRFADDGRRFGVEISYSWDGPDLRGTAGALKNALSLLGTEFFVMYGDSYLTCSFAQVQNAFLSSGKEGLMTVFPNGDRWDSSNVEFSHGEIRAYSKKSRTTAMQHIDYGLGVLGADAMNRMRDNALCDLAELYESMLRDRQLAAFEVADRFYEIGSFAGIEELSSLLTSIRDAQFRGDNELHSTVSV